MTEKLETEPNHRPWQMLLIPVLLVLSTLLFYGFTPILQILSAAYGWVAHQFFEVPQLAAIRQPTQLILLRYHLAIWMALLALYFAINGRISK
jgi:hypothetical protein